MEPTKEDNLSLTNLKEGALVELFNSKLAEIISNIQDPNTPAKAKRTITITATFLPDEDRFLTRILLSCQTKLPGTRAIETQCVMEASTRGSYEAREIVPRQQELFDGKGKVTSINHAKGVD